MFLLFTLLTSDLASADCVYQPKFWPTTQNASEPVIDLPLNTKPLVVYEYHDPSQIPFAVSIEGETQAIESELVSYDGIAYHLSFLEELSPNLLYTMYPIDEYALGAPNPSLFSTANYWDDEPPNQPIIEDIERSYINHVHDISDNVKITMKDQGDGARYYRVEFSEQVNFEASKTVWEIPHQEQIIAIGYNSDCTKEMTKEELNRLNHLRITAFDAAGNASESFTFVHNLDPIDETKQDQSTGCNYGVTNIGIWGVLSLLGLRRQRKPKA